MTQMNLLRCRRFALTFGLAASAGICGIATSGAAQEVTPLPLPGSRPLDQPPAVTDAGIERRVDGTKATLPRLAVLASMDLELYAAQLGTLFPRSADYYPADSLQRLRVSRANAWVTRLRALGRQIHGLELLDFAKIAIMAEQDSVAFRLIDARLAEIAPGPLHNLERSRALAGAVFVLTDSSQDSSRLIRTLSRAKSYATQLFAIPASGFATRTDSTDVLHRKLQAAQALMTANASAYAIDHMMHYSDRTFAVIAQMSPLEQQTALQEYPYFTIASVLSAGSNGRARVDSVEQRILALANGGLAGSFNDHFSWFSMLGHPAPPVSAHVWFNTPDSLYAATPRTHPFNDGIVRVLVFGELQSGNLFTVDRLQRQLPPGTQVVFITNIHGFVGQELVKPEAEVAWLTHYYRDIRHLVVPIALWAGAKVQSDYGWPVPMPSAVPSAYHDAWLVGKCVLVDGNGIIRNYLNATSRADEATIARRVGELLTESRHGTAARGPAH